MRRRVAARQHALRRALPSCYPSGPIIHPPHRRTAMPKPTRAAVPAGDPASNGATHDSTNGATSAAASPAAPHDTDEPRFPLDVLRVRADRLARAARESCHQHRRCASYCERQDVDATELAAMLDLAALADRQLAEAAEAYAKAGARLHPEGDDAVWWHKANGLWHAAREHVRRHAIGDGLARRVASEHSVERLGELHIEFELEASALLSLRQAADEYCTARPTAT